MPEGTIEVQLIRGHGLKDVETFGKSDPYVVLSCGHVTHRTRTMHDAGSNPIWNQNFLFEVPHGVENLSLAIYDFEGHGRDEAMGSSLISLAEVYEQREIAPANYKVRLRNGRNHGEVELGLKFFPKVYHGSLELHLVQGHGLISADAFDKSDPYAIITCNKQTVKSKVMENAGSDPLWNQTFAFVIDSEVTEAIIRLYDRDTYTADDPLGNAKIPLQMVFVEGCVPPTDYKVFNSLRQEQGEIKVGLKFVPKV
ncbi:hypothetical protein GOP47_0013859 [Adiantum capillus-veneris]|uniref:C2 domain-containing protein n=1 Tax=Adiantum capillus-veneris TaxID=13818 RepID=A0A9D4UPB4_ADICA|nr:hypothetical protein GOP47_0013859 [Adiantum capillus-veneris]